MSFVVALHEAEGVIGLCYWWSTASSRVVHAVVFLVLNFFSYFNDLLPYYVSSGPARKRVQFLENHDLECEGDVGDIQVAVMLDVVGQGEQLLQNS